MTTSVASEHFTESLLQLIRQQRHLASRIIIATQEPTISPKLLDLCTFTIVHRFSSPSWLETLRKHIAGLSTSVGTQSDGDPKIKVDDQPDQIDTWSTETNKPHDAFQDLATTASASPATTSNEKENKNNSNEIRAVNLRPQDFFTEIVRLEAGESLLFAPTALIDISTFSRTGNDGCHYNKNNSGFSGDSSINQQHLGAGVFRMRMRERVSNDGGRSKMAV